MNIKDASDSKLDIYITNLPDLNILNNEYRESTLQIITQIGFNNSLPTILIDGNIMNYMVMGFNKHPN